MFIKVFLCTCSFLYFSKGHIPLRHLVYRVHTLPGSMRPLIWDFGQLNNEVEALYTYQIVSRFVSASLGCQYTIKSDIVIYFLQVISYLLPGLVFILKFIPTHKQERMKVDPLLT